MDASEPFFQEESYRVEACEWKLRSWVGERPEQIHSDRVYSYARAGRSFRFEPAISKNKKAAPVKERLVISSPPA